jgi:hypothetical protein
MIQGMLLSHYLRSVNLGNYGLLHVLKSVTPYYAFTQFNKHAKGPNDGMGESTLTNVNFCSNFWSKG